MKLPHNIHQIVAKIADKEVVASSLPGKKIEHYIALRIPDKDSASALERLCCTMHLTDSHSMTDDELLELYEEKYEKNTGNRSSS